MSGQTDIGNAQESKIIVLKCDDDDSKSLEADLSILAEKSKYFEGCVSFAEKEITFDSKIVPFFALENLVQHCCESRSLYPKPEEIEQMIVAADYLQMENAMKALCERFSYTVPSRQAGYGDQLPKATIHMWLRLYNIIGKQKGFDETKMNWFGERMARQLKRVLHEVHFFKLDEDRLYDLMSSSHLRLTEEEVLKTIKAWINYDYKGRKNSFGRLARCVRPHPDLTTQLIVDELICQCSSPCTCLTSKDLAIALLVHKLDPKFKDWCVNGPNNWFQR